MYTFHACRIPSRNTTLPEYLNFLNEGLITEIVISDENGEDVRQLKEFERPNVRFYINDTLLGPFRNKLKVCRYATGNWICLMDSDNVAPRQYFEAAHEALKAVSSSPYAVLSPAMALPRFDFRSLEGIITLHDLPRVVDQHDVLLNTGNYILSAQIFRDWGARVTPEEEQADVDAYDVLYFNYLLFAHFNVHFQVVASMYYYHTYSEDGVWCTLSGIPKYQKLYIDLKAAYKSLSTQYPGS